MDILDSGELAFGRHTFDPARCELRSVDGPPVALGQRAGRLLHALIAAGGRVLSQDDLLRSAWPGQDVGQGNLRVQIAALRRALADDRELIGTVAGRGYLFAGRAERRGGVRPRLPGAAPDCIGRAALVDDVLVRCASRRFVTLAGTAGIGKTALALAVAHAHDGPAAWVELEGAQDEADVLAAVAAALGLLPEGVAALAARLAGVPLLLVLDNCEHVADTCSRLAETLLRQCPDLTVLATSRQPLLALGETVVRVPALALPAPDEADPARVAASSAVALFVRRAGMEAADGAALACAAAICRRLDGLPLAIELAAARVPALGVRQVAASLDERLDLLLGGAGQGAAMAAGSSAAAPVTPRHRTLRAALDWSYVLLAPSARLALRRIARWPSWFSLDDAVALLHPWQSPYDTIDSLASLAAHSLLVVDHAQGTARYRLLGTTRAYAAALRDD